MSHRIEIKVTIELTHISGKFASRDDMTESLVDQIIDLELSSVDDIGEDGTTSYEVTTWEVNPIEKPKPVRRQRRSTRR
jgi:hypothetical protein